MPVIRQSVSTENFNKDVELPYQLRLKDFEMAMQDVYDFFYDVNSNLRSKGLRRLDDMLRPAMMSGLLSDLLTSSMANHARVLVENGAFNGHPDLLVEGVYENDKTDSGEQGVEIKSTKKKGGAVDTHGAREQWLCVFVYKVDSCSQPAANRKAMQFREIYIAHVKTDDFRKNARGELGTRTATLHREGLIKLRDNWVFKI